MAGEFVFFERPCTGCRGKGGRQHLGDELPNGAGTPGERIRLPSVRARRGLRAGHAIYGSPRNLGTLSSPSLNQPDLGEAGPESSWLATSASAPARAKLGRKVVSPSDGNGARRDGRQDSEHLTVPGKRENLPQGIPWRERGAGSQDLWRERCREHWVPHPSQRDCKG